MTLLSKIQKLKNLDASASISPPCCFVQGHSTDQEVAWVLTPTADCEERLENYITTWDYVLEAIGDCPRTVSEWAEKQKACRKAPASPHMSGDYMLPWTVRSYMLALMTRTKVPALRVDPAATVNMLVNMNPDMSNSLVRIRSRLTVTEGQREVSVRDFLKKIGSGKPELASMWLCFAGDRGLKKTDFSTFSLRRWQEAAESLYFQHSVHPHPVAAP